MLYPEPADGRIAAGQGETPVGQGMGETGRIEIENVSPGPGPFDPGREMLREEFVPLHLLPAGLGVDGMEIEPVAAWDQAEGHVQVRAELIGVAGPAGITARGRQVLLPGHPSPRSPSRHPPASTGDSVG